MAAAGQQGASAAGSTSVAGPRDQTAAELIDREELMSADFDPLKLSNQLCFPLYATSRAVIRRYTPLLRALDLTYTQYLVMMVLWEVGSITVRELGDRLFLDSGTLTPLLKKMEAKGFLTRERDASDERKVVVSITGQGEQLREAALSVPVEMGKCVNLSLSEATELKRLLAKVMDNIRAEGE